MPKSEKRNTKFYKMRAPVHKPTKISSPDETKYSRSETRDAEREAFELLTDDQLDAMADEHFRQLQKDEEFDVPDDIMGYSYGSII